MLWRQARRAAYQRRRHVLARRPSFDKLRTSLGSTSVTSGAVSSAQTYYPYGAVRTTEGTLPTDYTFTGTVGAKSLDK